MTAPAPLPAFLAAWQACARRADAPLPAEVAQAARRSAFDTLAAMAAGTVENCTRAARGACEGTPPSATEAALVLGTASHALDYDDVCMLATCHPSAPVLSALLAAQPLLARERPALSLGGWLAAFALGTETMLRLGEWLGFRHYALGFHATGTLGTVGAAAAVAHALGLPPAQAHAALAIAASSACGLRANFGTDTKPLHVGLAASAGLRAVLLARAGATASDDVWGPQGFALAFNGGDPLAPLAWDGTQDWALARPGFELKRFPSCYLTHRLMAGLLAIRARQPEAVRGQPVRIDIELAHNGTAPLKHPQPATGLQGKFSGPYSAAAAWIDGRADLGTFTDAAVQRPALRAQMQQVTLRERERAGESLDTAPVTVAVEGAGWSDRITVDWAPGSLADPMTREQMLAKWRDCLAHAGLSADAVPAQALLDAPLDAPAATLLAPVREALLAAQ
ncbi:MmgE/PrpD family protein [Ramlibacter sp. MAHUQ-53]|uniref:MmgE/PrpD family protein n=1 Tax=unclassified Ramlibacter TaxID=2617605 RepID=UPI00362AD5F6